MLERDVFRASLFKPLVIRTESSGGTCGNNNALEQIPPPPSPIPLGLSAGRNRCERGIPIMRLDPFLRISRRFREFVDLSFSTACIRRTAPRLLKKPPLFIELREHRIDTADQLRQYPAMLSSSSRGRHHWLVNVRDRFTDTDANRYFWNALMEQGTARPGTHQPAWRNSSETRNTRTLGTTKEKNETREG